MNKTQLVAAMMALGAHGEAFPNMGRRSRPKTGRPGSRSKMNKAHWVSKFTAKAEYDKEWFKKHDPNWNPKMSAQGKGGPLDNDPLPDSRRQLVNRRL